MTTKAKSPSSSSRQPTAFSAGTKLLATLGFVFAVVAAGRGAASLPTFAVAAVGLLLAWNASGVPLRRWLERTARLEVFAVGAATLALWQPDGGRMFAFALVRATLCLGALTLLAETTPLTEILDTLRAARAPALFLTTLALMERYRFVLADESRRMRCARAGRTFEPSRRWRLWQGLAETLAGLFVRALTRSERIYSAMCARGWR